MSKENNNSNFVTNEVKNSQTESDKRFKTLITRIADKVINYASNTNKIPFDVIVNEDYFTIEIKEISFQTLKELGELLYIFYVQAENNKVVIQGKLELD